MIANESSATNALHRLHSADKSHHSIVCFSKHAKSEHYHGHIFVINKAALAYSISY